MTGSTKKKGGKDAIDTLYSLKVSKTVQSSLLYQEQMSVQTLNLLTQYFVAYSHSVAFPELIVAPVLFLKRFVKKTRIHRLRYARTHSFANCLAVVTSSLCVYACVQKTDASIDSKTGSERSVDQSEA